MKKILLASISLALTFGFYACKKSSDVSSNPSSNTELTVSKTTGIKSSEPLTFTLNTSRSATNTVTWTVFPAVGVSKAIRGNKATFKFSRPGEFLVASSDGVKNDSVLVTVNGIPYTGTDNNTYQPIDSSYFSTDTSGVLILNLPIATNDQLSIKPSFASSLITLSASSVQTYPSTLPRLISNYSWGGTPSGPVFTYTGVLFAQNTLTLTSPSVTTNIEDFGVSTGSSTPFSIVYKNKTYSGSVTVSGKTATFTWPYTSGVVISPLVISQ